MNKVDKQVKQLMMKIMSKAIDLNQSEFIECTYDVAGYVDSFSVKVHSKLYSVRDIELSIYYAGSLSSKLFSVDELNCFLIDMDLLKSEVEEKTTPEHLAEEKKKAEDEEKKRLLKRLAELDK